MDSIRADASSTPYSVDEITTRDELGRCLTDLRSRSGKSLRQLGRAIGSGPSTVGDWCRAKTLPFPGQDAVFVRLLEELGIEDTGVWVDALVRVRSGPRRARRDGTPPYRGLHSFRPQDRDWFFGRRDLVETTLKRLRRTREAVDRPRLLFVLGPSGSGKSSLLHAGLIPRLDAEGITAISVTPGPHPMATLTAAMADALGEVPPPDPLADPQGTAAASAWLDAALSGSDGAAHPPFALVVDQFEELFTQCDDEHERDAFVAALTAIGSTGDDGRDVVIGLRIDFYPDVAATERLAPALADAQVLVGPMSRAELTEAIVEPARRAGFSVDDDLVELVLHDFIPSGSLPGRHDPGSLPLLSHALLETWHHASRGRMTVHDYRAAGGITQAVEDSAEHAFGLLAADDRDPAREAFLRMVHVDVTGVATRRVATYEEIAGLAPGDTSGRSARELALSLLGPFVDARLVTTRESTVEIAHEALLAAWPRLRDWLDEDRDSLLLHRRISEATQVWLDHARDPSALAQGARLAAMQQWAGGDARRHLNRDERAFLTESTERALDAERSARRQARRLRVLLGATGAFGLLAATLAIVANDERSDAVTARDDALSRQLAVTAERLRGTDPTAAAHLAVSGYRVAPTSQARSALLQTADLPLPTRFTGGPGPTAVDASPGTGIVALSNSVDGTVQLFSQDGGGLVRAGLIQPDDPEADVYALALTPDENLLAVGDTAATVNLWNVSDATAPRLVAGPLHGPSGAVQRLAVTSDGSQIAASGEGDGIFRWDVTDPERPRPLQTIPSATGSWGLAYSPDGSHLAFGQDDGHVQMWALDGAPHQVHDLRLGEREIYTVAFSPDGRTLVAGSQNGELRAWNLAVPGPPDPIALPENRFRSWVNIAAFSPDGAYLVAGSSDATLRVWDAAEWTHAGDLPHPAPLTQATFTRDGDVLVTAATDGAARLWDLAAALPHRMDARVFSLAFSADGTRLAGFAGADTGVWDISDPARPVRLVDVASPDPDAPFSGSGDMTRDGRLLAQGAVDGTVHLVDVSEPDDPQLVGGPLGGSEALVEQVAFSADGSLLAAAGDDGTVRIWDVADPRRPRSTAVVTDTEKIVLNVTWSPTAPVLVANSADGFTYLYDVADPDRPRLVARLDGFDSESYAAAFTPDGRTLAVGGSDTVVILWDVDDPAHPVRIGDPITGPPSRVYDLSFAPDGASLAAAVTDGTIWVWDTGEMLQPARSAVLGPFEGPAFTVAVSPDGSLLAGSGADQEIHLWPTDEALAIDGICARVGDPMTGDEWTTHVPDQPFEPPC